MGTRMRAWLSVGMAAVCALLMAGCAQGEAALEVDMVNLSAAVEEREEIPAWAAPYVTEETGPCGQEIRRWSPPEPETLPEAKSMLKYKAFLPGSESRFIEGWMLAWRMPLWD